MQHVKIFFLAVLLAVSISLPATTIVIYITPSFVIMAADSRGIFTNAKTYKKTSKIVSKIYKTGNVYFSLAGLTANTTKSFDVGEIVDKKFKNEANVTKAIDSIKQSVSQALISYLNNQKKTNRTLFLANLNTNTYITSIGIVTILNSKPYAHIIGFKITDGDELKISAEEEFYQSNSRDAVYYLGTSGEINKYMNTVQSNKLSPEQFVDKLMNLQIAKTPSMAGAPVDMLKLTPLKTIWVRRKKSTPVELK